MDLAGAAATPGLPFLKGHGTGNDFVVLPDEWGRLQLDAAAVAAICDRRSGIGADGVLRVVRTAALGEPERDAAGATSAEWFMDYRNADGSLAQMCGNGIRVFVRFLADAGLIALPDGGELLVATRAGDKTVRRVGDDLAADLGPWHLPGGEAAVSAGHDHLVEVPGLGPHPGVALPGLAVDVGNPHVVLALPTEAALAAADLSRPPTVAPAPEQGCNVELVLPRPDGATLADGSRAGHLRMRVHERGSGETRSCGTGTVAAVLAARAWAGPGAPTDWIVDVPGGRLQVQVSGELLAGAGAWLTGPAVIVAEGLLHPDRLARPAAGEVAPVQPAGLSAGAVTVSTR
jgi:diaminopimelate epimerase